MTWLQGLLVGAVIALALGVLAACGLTAMAMWVAATEDQPSDDPNDLYH